MRRLIRPVVFTAISVVAIAAFVLAGRLSVERLDWSDIGGWLDRVEPVDALAELARWIGLGLAVYVAIVSATALLAEMAAMARLPRLNQLLRRLVCVVALPALRRRLLELTTVATITAASLQSASAAAITTPSAPVMLVADATTRSMWALEVRGQFEGFGAVSTPPAPVDEIGRHTVERGDTLWDIVDRHYGRVDASLVDVVVRANPQIEDPNLILVGWVIALPDLPAVTSAPPPPEPLLPAPAVDGDATWTVVIVQRGDTLWDIVDRHYGHATADLVWATAEANPTIDDPSLIYAGQQITLPPVGDLVPTAPRPDPPPVALPATVEPAAPVAPSAPPAEVPPSTALPTRSIPVEAVPLDSPDSVPTSDEATVTSVGSPAATAVTLDDTETTDGTVRPSLAALIGWTGGAGLAAALLGLAARRRRRLPTPDRHRRPDEAGIELGVALHETENLATVDWAANALRALGAGLRPRPGQPTPVPRLLRLAGDEIELVWDSPNTDTSTPWRTADGGWSWTITRTDARANADAPAPCPTLVTIGRRDGADVLLNLESCGALAVTGEVDAVTALTRSLATELAASAFADAPTVLVVGGNHVAADPDHARVVDVTEALGWLRDRTDSAGALLAHRRLTSLFALRARSRPQDAHEPVIVVVDATVVAEDELGSLVELANGDLGAVLIVAGGHPSITWQLNCADGVIDVQPLALSLDAVGLSADLNPLIEQYIPEANPELEDSDEDGFEDEEPVEFETVLADHLEAIRLRERPGPAADIEPGEDDWDIELKVLGQVRSVGTKEPLTPTELHLAIYLAFHRDGQCSDTISTMIWPKGAAARTVTNAMAAVRRKLGTGADGEALFPLGRDHQYLYRLSPQVVTDWDRFVALIKRAEVLPPDDALRLLDRALELVDGPPFRAPSGYSWAYSDGTATLITETVKAVGKRCVELHVERGELVEAELAASRSAKATDSGDAEAAVPVGSIGGASPTAMNPNQRL